MRRGERGEGRRNREEEGRGGGCRRKVKGYRGGDGMTTGKDRERRARGEEREGGRERGGGIRRG